MRQALLPSAFRLRLSKERLSFGCTVRSNSMATPHTIRRRALRRRGSALRVLALRGTASGHQPSPLTFTAALVVQLAALPPGAALWGARILVAAHTNTAVDRVLTGLKDTGFTGKGLQCFAK